MSAIRSVLTIGVLLSLGASVVLAQGKLQFKVGDEVEVYSSYSNTPTWWGKATVIAIDTSGSHKGPYLVHFEGRDHTYDEWMYADAEHIRPRAGQTTAIATQPSQPARSDGSRNGATNGGQFKVGDRIDVYYANHSPKSGKGRGTVIEVGDGRYKVHYDGCESHWDAWEDRMSVRTEAVISATDPEMRFLIGNWAMFTPSYPNTVVRGDSVYRQYGPGAKAPPLQINADGSYVWYFDFGKPPVKGKWTTHSKVGERIESEGTSRTVTDSGIIIKDPAGQEWKVYRWVMPDDKDRITAQRMCSGLTMIGSRIK